MPCTLLDMYYAGGHHADPYCKLLQRVSPELAGMAVCGRGRSRVYVASPARQSHLQVGDLFQVAICVALNRHQYIV